MIITNKEAGMEALLTRKELMALLRLKGDDAIIMLERKGLPYPIIGNRKRYRARAVEAFLETLEQANSHRQPQRPKEASTDGRSEP
jgi:hypothetical protein